MSLKPSFLQNETTAKLIWPLAALLSLIHI